MLKFDYCWSLFGFLLDIFWVFVGDVGVVWFFLELLSLISCILFGDLCRDGEPEKIKEIVVEFWTLELRFRCLKWGYVFLLIFVSHGVVLCWFG